MSDTSWSATFFALWRVLLPYGLFWAVSWLNSDVLGGYLRSRVQCDATGPHATPFCRDHPQQCVPHAASSKDWSGSAHCFDKGFVLQQSTRTLSAAVSWGTAVQVVAVPMGGSLADLYGRKRVMVFGMTVGTLLGAFLVASCYSAAPEAWLYPGFAIAGSGGAFDSAALSAAADSSARDTASRGASMAAMFICKQLAILAAFTLGYWVLSMDLEDYRRVWGTYTAISVAFALLGARCMRETLSPAARSTAAASLREGLALMWRDKFIAGFVVVVLLNCAGVFGSIVITSPYLIGTYGYSQARASITGIAQQPCIIAGVALAKGLMRLSAERVQGIGLAVLAGGLGIQASGLGQVTWWLGFVVVGVSYGMLDTSRITIISLRVGEEHQAKLQGVIQLCYLVGQTAGQLVWGRDIFSSGADAGVGFLVSSAISCFCLCWFLGLLCLYPGPGADQARPLELPAVAERSGLATSSF